MLLFLMLSYFRGRSQVAIWFARSVVARHGRQSGRSKSNGSRILRGRGVKLKKPAAVILHGAACEGETLVDHGGPKRAPSPKRWTHAK
jgi:hypothetical protein